MNFKMIFGHGVRLFFIFALITGCNKNIDEKLVEAVEMGDYLKVKEALDKKANPDYNNNNKKITVLMKACSSGREDIVQLLLEKGADTEMQDRRDRTALMWAAWKGHATIVTLLIENDAEVNVVSKFKMTALLFARKGGSEAVVEILLKANATGMVIGAGDDS